MRKRSRTARALRKVNNMPKTRWDGYHRFCPLARGLDIIGERWTLVIAHSLLGGPARYGELKEGLPGIGTNVLSDRLRKLEDAGVVKRTLRDAGQGVAYELTDRGYDLAPLMAEVRRWGADQLLADTEEPIVFDLSYAIPPQLELDESYEWRIDGRPITLTIKDQRLTQTTGAAGAKPALVVETTADFMRRWAAGDTNWDQGRASGEVLVEGPEEAWDRMLVATNYPGRRADLAEQLLQRQDATR